MSVSAPALAGLAVAANLITACACYGGPVSCSMVMHRGALVDGCKATINCVAPLADGGSPAADPTDTCFSGATNPSDAGTDGG